MRRKKNHSAGGYRHNLLSILRSGILKVPKQNRLFSISFILLMYLKVVVTVESLETDMTWKVSKADEDLFQRRNPILLDRVSRTVWNVIADMCWVLWEANVQSHVFIVGFRVFRGMSFRWAKQTSYQWQRLSRILMPLVWEELKCFLLSSVIRRNLH